MPSPTGKASKLYVRALTAGEKTAGGFDTSDVGAAEAAIKADATLIAVCKRDANRAGTKETADASDDCTNGYMAKVPTFKDASITFDTVKRKPLQAAHAVLETAYHDDSMILVVLLDDARTVEGANGIAYNANVNDFSESYPLRDVISNSIQLDPAGESAFPPIPITIPV